MSKLGSDSDWALVVSPEPPYPVAGGGPTRTASIVEFLAARSYVHLVTFAAGECSFAHKPAPEGVVARLDWVRLPEHGRGFMERAIRNASRLMRGVLPLSDRFGNGECRLHVARALAGRRYEVAVLEHFWTAGHLETVRAHAGRVVLDLHNIESALHEGCARGEAGAQSLMHRAFGRVAAREEQEHLAEFDLVLAASEGDRKRVLKAAPRARVEVYPNAIPLRFPAEVEEEHVVAFSGNLEYHPNQAAVRYFAREVWPALRQRDGRLRWRLIGKNEWAVRRWTSGDERIEATGVVEDALLELARARVVVVPLLAGSGTRVKILEAWAAGRAVVSTRVGAEGLPAADGENLLLADQPGEMVEAVVKLLGDRELRRRLGRRGRQLVEEQLAWPSAWEKLERSLAGLGCLAAPAKIG